MRRLALSFVYAVFVTLSTLASLQATESPKDAQSIYEFKAKDIDGNEVSLDKYK